MYIYSCESYTYIHSISSFTVKNLANADFGMKSDSREREV